ncbi:unnamed protein product [Rhizopus microsporus]
MLYSTLIAAGLLLSHSVSGHVIDKRQQKDAVKSPELPPLRPLVWGDVNFIHTTDTHGWLEGHVLEGSYNGDLGDFYSFTVRMKEKARKLKKDLFIVDTGDTHDGDGLSDVTDPRGEVSQPLLTNIPYDLLTIGNHELYVNNITVDTIKNFIPHWKDRYLAANVYFKDLHNNKTVQIGNKYTYFKGEFGTRVLAYGFLFNFMGNGDMSVVNLVENEIRQPWFNQSLRAYEPDIITLIGHVGIRFDEFHHIIEAIRAIHPTIPIAVLGGHTHIRDFVQYDNRAAGIESGRYLETIGFFSIEGLSRPTGNLTFNRRYLDQNRPTYIFHSVDGKEEAFDTHVGKKMTEKIQKLRKKFQLSELLGCAPQTYPLSAVPVNDNSSVFRLITQEVMPKVVADHSRPNTPYFLYNSGGIRYDVYKGPFTLSNMYQLSPFEDKFYAIFDVPLSVARKVLPALNHEGEMKKRSIWPHGLNTHVQEFHTVNKTKLTLGYVTKDDYGTGGDDTPHIPLPYYPSPAFVGSDLPNTQNNSALVDIVYLDFFDNQLRSLLFNLTDQTWKANTTYSTFTSSTMWIEFAKTAWKQC